MTQGPTEPVPVPPAIRVRRLWHRFGRFDVLRDVSFDVGQGEIFGFIGPNGAGKTTTIRIMATLLEPTFGRVEIEGVDVSVDPERVRRMIGYMPDHAGVYERITVREYLEFFADAYGVEQREVVDAVIELTELRNLSDRLVAALSKGLKQRLQVARILLHDPQVLILDEPASDLDPRARIEIRDLLLELRELNKTIFLSSHVLTELSDICTSIGILERGQLLVAGPIGEIAERLQAERAQAAEARAAEATVVAPPFGLPDLAGATGAGTAVTPSPMPEPQTLLAPTPALSPLTTPGGAPVPEAARKRLRLRVLCDARVAAGALSGGTGIHAVEPGAGGALSLQYTGDENFVAAVVRHLVVSGIPVVAVEPERNELERIFLEVTRGELS
ncbi:MAG TPA: ABC transporter ATP-binding protein [Polyangiaceae bacterium]